MLSMNQNCFRRGIYPFPPFLRSCVVSEGRSWQEKPQPHRLASYSLPMHMKAVDSLNYLSTALRSLPLPWSTDNMQHTRTQPITFPPFPCIREPMRIEGLTKPFLSFSSYHTQQQLALPILQSIYFPSLAIHQSQSKDRTLVSHYSLMHHSILNSTFPRVSRRLFYLRSLS